MPKSNSQQKVPRMPSSATSKWGGTERSRQHCLGAKEGLSNSREELVGCGPAHSPLEAGGTGEGKGANLAPEMASLTKLQTASQFLTKDFLRFWMVDILQEGRS